MIRAVIFDLDQTLIASSAAEPYRKPGRWTKAYELIPGLTPYEGVHELIQLLRSNDVRIAVVTSSPRTYCTRVLTHWKWEFDAAVCYHDTALRKPHPAPMLRALELLGVSADQAVAVGDTAGDVQSAHAAGIFAIAATWGAPDEASLLAQEPDLVCRSIVDLRKYLGSQLPPKPPR